MVVIQVLAGDPSCFIRLVTGFPDAIVTVIQMTYFRKCLKVKAITKMYYAKAN